jgi:hypothetical protein
MTSTAAMTATSATAAAAVRLHPVNAIGRAAATGALMVTLVCAAIAAENIHTGARVLDWTIGVVLVGVPIALACGLLRLVTRMPAWFLRRISGRPGRLQPFLRSSVRVLELVGQPWIATLMVIGWMVLASSDEGPFALYHGLFYFEILIGIGSLVGAMVGLATVVRDHRRPPGPRRRRIAAGIAGAAAVLGLATLGWAATPGPGDPIVRDEGAVRASIPTLALPDPSVPGAYAVASTAYGSGQDRHRSAFGAAASWRTPIVDASKTLPERDGIAKVYADWFWGFDRDDLPLNALLWYPKDAPGRRPVVLIAHGNHAAGDFSEGGYAYLGEHLASRGYVVASIDEDYLNGDAFFDYAGAEIGVRAWLLLRHIELFADWDRSPGHPLEGRVDLDRVALIGHSRGGEAAALASMMSTEPSLTPPGLPVIDAGRIRSVVGIAPSDGMYRGPGAPVAPKDVDYLVIQGAHDGDLPGFSGLRTYHRTTVGQDGLKVAMLSHRANHGRFNSVWGDRDAGPLPSWLLDRGSALSDPEQQRLAKTVFTAFLARSLDGRLAYDAFFREPRSGRDWLPEDVIETHWETGRRVALPGDGPKAADDAAVQARDFDHVTRVVPMLRDGVSQGDAATVLRWSRPASYTVRVDLSRIGRLDRDSSLVFSIGQWIDGTAPVDPVIELDLDGGVRTSIQMSAVSPSRPLLPARLWKIDGIGERYLPTERQILSAERFLQTHALPLDEMLAPIPGADPRAIRSVRFRFEGAGSVLLDDVGFEIGARSVD